MVFAGSHQFRMHLPFTWVLLVRTGTFPWNMLFSHFSLQINLCSFQNPPFLPVHFEYALVVLYHGMCHFCILASSMIRLTNISILPLVPRDKKMSIATMAMNILVSRKGGNKTRT